MWLGIESTVPIGPPGFFATVLTGLGVLPTNTVMCGAFSRALCRTRTGDPFLTMEVLYQLS
jgi:hypothetical protein